MEILISILATIPLSYAVDFLSQNDMFRKAAEEGYLPNIEAFKRKGESDKDSKFDKYKRYIPILCLIESLSNAFDKAINKQLYFEELRIHGCFDSMTKEEEDYYNKKKSIWSIYNLANKRRLKYNEEDKECLKSNIRYLDKKLDNHEIVVKENNKEDILDIDSYIKGLNKDQLEELKNNLNLLNNWDQFFDNKQEGDYTLKEDKSKKLIYRFKCKENDK